MLFSDLESRDYFQLKVFILRHVSENDLYHLCYLEFI